MNFGSVCLVTVWKDLQQHVIDTAIDQWRRRQIAKTICGTQTFPLTGLCRVLDPIVRRRSSLFEHVARLPEDTPTHQALQGHIDLSLGHLYRPEVEAMSRPPSEQVAPWLDQLLLTSGDEPSRVDTRGRRYGPRQLRALTTVMSADSVERGTS